MPQEKQSQGRDTASRHRAAGLPVTDITSSDRNFLLEQTSESQSQYVTCRRARLLATLFYSWAGGERMESQKTEDLPLLNAQQWPGPCSPNRIEIALPFHE